MESFDVISGERALPGRPPQELHDEILRDQSVPFKSDSVSRDGALVLVPEKSGEAHAQKGHGASLSDDGYQEPLVVAYVHGLRKDGNHLSPSGQTQNSCPDQGRHHLLSWAFVKTGLLHFS